LNHDELASDLASHLRGASQRVTWEDMQLGPSGSVRPDVYTMEPTYTRLTFEAFECKVSVADFRSDVTSGKWQAYLKYANAVTFAAPRGLISKADVPTTCGLILRSESGWRFEKKPVRHVLHDIPWQAWIKLLLDGTQRSGFDRRATYFNEYLARKKLAAKFGEQAAQQIADLQNLPMRLEHAKDAHETAMKRMRESEAAEHARLNEARQQELARCTDAVSDLAIALGLPADARVRDLTAVAHQVLKLLESHRFGRHPINELAGELEAMAGRLRTLHDLFTQH
jgi:hypothetical protein